MSRPVSACLCSRNDSRICRLRRFRCVARRQFFFDTAKPSLAGLPPFDRYSTVNKRSLLRLALPNTRLNEAASSNRFSRRNRLSGAAVVDCLSLAVAVGLAWRRLRGKLRATLGASALQDQAAGFRRHSCSKPVGARTLEFAGLKCAFHYLKPVSSPTHICRPKRGRQDYAGV